ncbi:hypothetical protein GGI42DRAFT_24486 [Trichoderma sp. SZMC 28013]
MKKYSVLSTTKNARSRLGANTINVHNLLHSAQPNQQQQTARPLQAPPSCTSTSHHTESLLFKMPIRSSSAPRAPLHALGPTECFILRLLSSERRRKTTDTQTPLSRLKLAFSLTASLILQLVSPFTKRTVT